MDVSFVGISRFYTGATSEFVFGTVPITFNENYFLIGIVASSSINLNPVLPQNWNLISQIENEQSTGTTIVATFQPTGSTINPVIGIGGLSNNLNAAYLLLFSGCTKNQFKILNYEDHKTHSTGVISSDFQSTKLNSMAIRLLCIFSGTSISSWSSTPSLTWTEIADSSKVLGNYGITIGIAMKNNIDDTNYSLSNTISTSPIPPNNTHNLSLTKRPTNVNLIL